ncbi:hypothetical protein SRHO_G00218200 [Serrasalmus rhombeus]
MGLSLIHIGDTESEDYQQITYEIKALSSVYAIKAGSEATKFYLEELQSVADLSGQSLAAVLQEELAKVNESIVQAAQGKTLGEGLTRSEARYPAHKLVFLALNWAVVDKFSDYLYGNTFTVLTDRNPLTYILTSAKLDATSYRWLSALSTFLFDLQYRRGKQNLDVDGLSRRPHGELIDDPASQKEHERIR